MRALSLLLIALSSIACGTSETPPAVVDASKPLDATPVDDGAVVCNAKCTKPAVCCQNQCVQTDNDPAACGACGVHCSGATPYCDNGKCLPQPCTKDASACMNPLGCCGADCCGGDQICCKDRTNSTPFCHTPNGSQPSCP